MDRLQTFNSGPSLSSSTDIDVELPESFDPIQEIRRLRKELSERLEQYQLQCRQEESRGDVSPVTEETVDNVSTTDTPENSSASNQDPQDDRNDKTPKDFSSAPSEPSVLESQVELHNLNEGDYTLLSHSSDMEDEPTSHAPDLEQVHDRFLERLQEADRLISRLKIPEGGLRTKIAQSASQKEEPSGRSETPEPTTLRAFRERLHERDRADGPTRRQPEQTDTEPELSRKTDLCPWKQGVEESFREQVLWNGNSRSGNFSRERTVVSLPDEEAFEPKVTLVERLSSCWLPILHRVNAGMVMIGFLSLVLGVLCFLRYAEGSDRLGLSIAIVGVLLILVGSVGRVAQEYWNRRAREKKGKLTIAS